MKGTNVSAWIKSCKKLYSEELVNRALEENGIPITRVFNPLEDVDEGLTNRMMASIAKRANVSLSELWRKVGFENIGTFFEMYSGFFKHSSAYNFLKSMNDVHKIVMRRFVGAKPPILDMEPISSRSAYFTYRSKRGMFDYFLGMMEGTAAHYNENVEMQVVSQTDSELKLKLTFPKSIQRTRWYWANAILSLGIFRSISFKIALLNGLAVGALSFFTMHDMASAMQFAGLSMLVTFGAAFVINLPQLAIRGELKQLTKKNFADLLNLRSLDSYQSLNKQINELKEEVQKDFIGFNAMVDEMYTFNKAVSTISLRMNQTSDNISLIVKELAAGANAQASDTEKSILILNDNLRSIDSISKEEQENKNLLETAVDHIENSFEDVQVTASKILEVLGKFNEIRNYGNELLAQATNITSIVSMVSQISHQTKLLALNASIEAARAGGTAGKSFSVVATEVRVLSNRTKDAVESINSILTDFVTKIKQLVEDVDVQYTILESESDKLAQAVHSSSNSNEQIKLVSEKLADTSQKLQAQTVGISTLFEKMEGLAAIAQQNGAASEDASRNVHFYTEQTKELTSQILVFDKLIQSFKDDLEKYSI